MRIYLYPQISPALKQPGDHPADSPANRLLRVLTEKKILFSILPFLCWTCFIHPGTAYSQWQGDTLYRALDEIEVTATKNLRALSEVPGRVGVISAEEISLTPASNLVDLLKLVSGVHTSGSLGFFSMRPSVTVRGLSAEEQSRTLVMIDGVPMNNTDSGGVNWNSISNSQVQQVEIYKGPGSSLYGSNAMGGVINIITRPPSDTFTGSAGLSYGTYNTIQSHLNLSGKASESLRFQLNGFLTRSDGYNTLPASERANPDFTVPRYIEDAGVNAGVFYKISDAVEAHLAYDLFLNKRGEGVTIMEPGMYREFDKNRLRAGLRGRYNDLGYHLNLFFQREDYLRVSERGVPEVNYSRFDVDSKRDDAGASLDLFMDAGARHSLTGGLEYRTGSVDGGDFYQTSDDVVLNSGSMHFLSAYLQDELHFSDQNVYLQFAMRFDHVTFKDGFFEASENIRFRNQYLRDFNDANIESNRWSTFSPRIAVRYNPTRRASGYASYSRGFRASILDDLTRTGIFRGRVKIVNPYLGPETLDNFELGVDYRPAWRWSVTPSVFYSHGKDFLYFVEFKLDDGADVWRRENITSVRLTGTEWDLRFFASDALTLSSNYTFYRSEILSYPDRPDLEGNELTYSPRHQASGSILWSRPAGSLALTVLYRGEQFTNDDNTAQLDSFVTFNTMVSRRVIEGLTASLQVIDVLDNRYMETVDHRSPGRMMMMQIRYDFSR